MNNPLDLSRLSAPFPPDEIEWRVGSTNSDKTSGLALAYLTARHVMDRLDQVCSPEGWQCSYEETPKGRIICTISIKVGSDWISKSDGAGDTDVEGDKGAISDALKRAAVPWGIGRYLYDLENIWVEIEGAGKSYRIKKSEKAKLVRALGGKPSQAPTEPSKPSTPSPKTSESKQKTVAERKAIWAQLMDDLKGEAPKGWQKMVAYMQHPDTVSAVEELGSYKDQFLNEARELTKLAKVGEEAAGEPVAKAMARVMPNFDNLNTEPVPDALDEILSQAEEKLNER